MTTTTTYTCAAEQGVDTFLQHYIAPILKENDELRKEILRLQAREETHRLHTEKYTDDVSICFICEKSVCFECDVGYDIETYCDVCSECDKFYCGYCKYDIAIKSLCKNCTRAEN